MEIFKVVKVKAIKFMFRDILVCNDLYRQGKRRNRE